VKNEGTFVSGSRDGGHSEFFAGPIPIAFEAKLTIFLFCFLWLLAPVSGIAHGNNSTDPSHSENGKVLKDENSEDVKKSVIEETSSSSTIQKSDHHEETNKPLMSKLFPGLSGAQDIHPMFVHFPIVLVFTALFFAVLSLFGRSDQFIRTARWLFWLALVALPVTVLTGFIAVGGWGDGHVVGHRNWMILTLVSAYLLFGVTRWVADRDRLYRIVLTVGLLIVSVLMTLGADRGSWLVYVEGAGVTPAEHVHEH
jgi:uncharacterized membrane protein